MSEFYCVDLNMMCDATTYFTTNLEIILIFSVVYILVGLSMWISWKEATKEAKE
ncbi:hypothetical protein LCGC14_2218900 [marine sediment metagenome]|uniref:Uncharacterized protein n=1 Tax=marine sediment metagenome TaxID=412755 RepID=A0A0F9DZ43_9ZZZZ